MGSNAICILSTQRESYQRPKHKITERSVQAMSKSREQLNEHLKKINIEEQIVLDVGVQDKPTSRLTEGTPKKYYTLDIDPKWNPDIIADLNEPLPEQISEQKEKLEKKGIRTQIFRIDTIFCVEVLEHCWNPVQCLENMEAMLKHESGRLYISTPFINPHHDTHDYLRYTGEWYAHVLPKLGFKDIKIHERVATLGKTFLREFYKAEGLRVSKIRPEYGKYTYPIGYFVEASK